MKVGGGDTLRFKCLVQEHNKLIQIGLEHPLIDQELSSPNTKPALTIAMEYALTLLSKNKT